VLRAVDAQKQSRDWTKDGGKYIPLATTWLNQERWDAEMDHNGYGSCKRMEGLGF